MKAIILSSTKYKETDGVIDAITDKGPITLFGKGIYKPTAKNHHLVDGLLLADIETVASSTNQLIIRRSKILANPRKPTNDYYNMASILLIAELTKKCLNDEDKKYIYPHLEAAITSLSDSAYPWNIVLVYMAKILKINGYQLEVNACVNCGSKKKIKLFSFKEGGFLCETCANELNADIDLTPDQLILIRDVFNAPDYVHFGNECTLENALILINKFDEFISEVLGANLKQIKFFVKK